MGKCGYTFIEEPSEAIVQSFGLSKNEVKQIGFAKDINELKDRVTACLGKLYKKDDAEG